MIDTDKYENHDMIRIAKQLLIEDAPLLLAEVKRLREQNEILRKQAFELHHMICINIIENLTPKELHDKASDVYKPHSTHTTTNQPLFGIGDW